METWHLPDVPSAGRRDPRVLLSTEACRAVLLDLAAGDLLGDHEVRERSILLVVGGRVTVTSGGTEILARTGGMISLEPHERHAVRAIDDARLLLLLAPWPAPGHHAGSDAVDPGELHAASHSPGDRIGTGA